MSATISKKRQKAIYIPQSSFYTKDNCKSLIELNKAYKMKENAVKNYPQPLDRLTLNVSNICNMRCIYCYATQGVYYTSGILMDQKTALNSINYALRNFTEIKLINFFGGEPTLNKPIIEMICEYVIYLYNHGFLKQLPKFSLTTNGFEIDKRMFEIIDGYSFRVSISMDGPQEIHDRLRYSKLRNGTYNAIKDNVKTLIDMGIETEFECTYTKEHQHCGIDMITLMDFFFDTFNCHVLHCPTVVAKKNSPFFIPLETSLELYTDAIRYSVENLFQEKKKSISIAARLWNSISTKAPICHYCPAGQSTLTINADGNVYPCFMLMNDPSFYIGNVNELEKQRSQSFPFNPLIVYADKQQNEACQKCWAQPICFGCIGDDFIREEKMGFRSEIAGQSDLCDYKRSLIEVFLKTVTEFYF